MIRIIAVLCFVGVTLIGTATSASAQSGCVIDEEGIAVGCTYTYTKPGGGTTTVTCNSDPVLGCPYVTCDTHIADDAAHPQGITWDVDDPSRLPIPSGDEEVTDAIVAVVAGTVTFGPPPPGYTAPPPYASLPGGEFSETGRWYRCGTHTRQCRTIVPNCTDPSDTVSYVSYEYGPEGPVLEPETLLDQALAQLVIPDPPVTTAPPVNTQMFVKLPTWFWVDQAYWNELRVSEVTSPGGRLTVRVIGEPQYTQIDPGDGSATVNCTGAGTAFLETMDPWAGTDCLHIYEHTPEAVNGTDAFEVAMSVAFTLRWEMDFDTQPAQDRGTMGNVSRANTQSVGVTEIQALVLEAGR